MKPSKFPGRNIGESESTDPPDLRTGFYGIAVTLMLFGFDIKYYQNIWSVAPGRYLSDREVARLKAPYIETNVPDEKILFVLDLCKELSENYGTGN